jgi:hypothetical protein
MEDTMSKENLNKSIDAMIDELFAEKPVEKSLDVASLASTKADQVADKAPKAQKDEARGAGRPKQISDVPQNDMDGKREGDYDDSIAAKQKEDEPDETDQVKTSDQTKGKQDKSQAPMMKSISAEEYAQFEAFKKAQAEKAQEEVLKKTQESQKDLIKAVIKEATASISKENEELKKSLSETQELVKAMAERPQRRKSIDGLQALEKSQSDEDQGPQAFSKSEMLDAAEELVMKKSTDFRDDHLIELENTGFIFDNRARTVLENHLKKRK